MARYAVGHPVCTIQHTCVVRVAAAKPPPNGWALVEEVDEEAPGQGPPPQVADTWPYRLREACWGADGLQPRGRAGGEAILSLKMSEQVGTSTLVIVTSCFMARIVFLR